MRTTQERVTMSVGDGIRESGCKGITNVDKKDISQANLDRARCGRR